MTKTRFIVLTFTIILLMISLIINADEGDNHNLTIEDVLEEIRNVQDVKSNTDINPDKVSDDLLEKLGEAVMNVQHPDPKEHEFMDNMMGGEESESLKAMHKWMGYNYIKDGYDVDSLYQGRGMMDPWMHRGWRSMIMGGTGPYNRNWSGHMGYGFHWGFWLFLILVAGAITTTVIVLVKKRSSRNGNNTHAIDILKRRLAKGEISKEEFDSLKQDVI